MYNVFPLAIVGIVVVLSALAGLAFRSVAVGVQVLVSVAVTLSWCIGAGEVVFASGLFPVNAGMRETHRVSWLAPVLTQSLVLGLCLDYAVFLWSRVVEYRAKGCSDQDAIVIAFCKTGGIITSAGCIMVIAFGSLMISHQMLLVEAGFYLSLACFLDTFVVRTVLCLAMMAIGGHRNWWPRRMPPVVR